MQMGINPEFIRKIRSNYDIINTCNQFTNLLVIYVFCQIISNAVKKLLKM